MLWCRYITSYGLTAREGRGSFLSTLIQLFLNAAERMLLNPPYSGTFHKHLAVTLRLVCDCRKLLQRAEAQSFQEVPFTFQIAGSIRETYKTFKDTN